ncbi:hypothetical protein BHE90_002444 [Fusarium euwallaceae]|uniref:Uncharacterized protein n=1 Tax=Fusarium euwallaceae TaxID=1147111 RepID=A0A430M4Z1_9HYPO|nr:hypothetical protein BHE90_002444 [Fusarium euwallaceae]
MSRSTSRPTEAIESANGATVTASTFLSDTRSKREAPWGPPHSGSSGSSCPEGVWFGATGRKHTLLSHQSEFSNVKARGKGDLGRGGRQFWIRWQKSARVRDDQSATIAGEASRGPS